MKQGWKSFVTDPDVPPILKEAGHVGKPQMATLAASTARSTYSRVGSACALGLPQLERTTNHPQGEFKCR